MSHVGLGWRSPHYQALLERREPLAFLEVHSENFFAEGGAAMEVLRQGREAYDISLHGVGLALGSEAGLDPWHLDQLARLVERVQPVRVSDHASFARAPLSPGQMPVHGADLLPVGFTPAALDIMVSNVQQVQDRLRRPLLVENLSAYVRWTTSTLSEAEFLNALARRSGCSLLLDVNNLVVNALNAAEADPVAAACVVVDALARETVGEIHLAGYNDEGVLVIDDHGSRVHEPVWQVYAHAVARFGRVPTLIEWDTDVPPLDVLLDEVRRAELVADAVSKAQREAA
ncbi:MAG: hypothetical protein C4K60_07785 [Ideonella sp. MAG2]|nr:MAG: hypothetical protein C4K60_07785 [Ideonella sp. MAG2]